MMERAPKPKTGGKRGRVRSTLDEAGQSTIEFALTLVLLMAFVLFYVQLTLVFAFGNYVHYATFMSARAYLAAGMTPGDQEERANAVITETLKERASPGTDRFPSLGKGQGGGDIPGLQVGGHPKYVENDKNYSWLQGVRYTFKSRLILLTFGGSPSAPDANTVTLQAESWLGREPSYNECKALVAGGSNAEIVAYDNGC